MPKRYMQVSRHEDYAVKHPEIVPLIRPPSRVPPLHSAVQTDDSVDDSMSAESSNLNSDVDMHMHEAGSEDGSEVDDEPAFDEEFHAQFVAHLQEDELILPPPIVQHEASLQDTAQFEQPVDGAGVEHTVEELENNLDSDSESEPESEPELLRDTCTHVGGRFYQPLREGEKRLGRTIYNPPFEDPGFRIRITSGGQYGFRIADTKNVNSSGEENESVMTLVDQAAKKLYIPTSKIRVQRGGNLDPPGTAKHIDHDFAGPRTLTIGQLLSTMIRKQYRVGLEARSRKNATRKGATRKGASRKVASRKVACPGPASPMIASEEEDIYQCLYIIGIKRTVQRGQSYYYPELQYRP